MTLVDILLFLYIYYRYVHMTRVDILLFLYIYIHVVILLYLPATMYMTPVTIQADTCFCVMP